MKTLGNILWHIPFLGFVSATIVYLFGLLLTVTIIAAPVGLGLMELGKFLFWPFGKTMIRKTEIHDDADENYAWTIYSNIVMILYFPFGLILSILLLLQIIVLFVTIIGIPAALVVSNSLGTFFNPVNKICVPSAVKDELERRHAQRYLDQHLSGRTG